MEITGSGMEHELAYLRYLEKLGFKVWDLRAMGNEEEAIVETVKLMKQGTDIIAELPLSTPIKTKSMSRSSSTLSMSRLAGD